MSVDLHFARYNQQLKNCFQPSFPTMTCSVCQKGFNNLQDLEVSLKLNQLTGFIYTLMSASVDSASANLLDITDYSTHYQDSLLAWVLYT